jgi:hypothetical protein
MRMHTDWLLPTVQYYNSSAAAVEMLEPAAGCTRCYDHHVSSPVIFPSRQHA